MMLSEYGASEESRSIADNLMSSLFIRQGAVEITELGIQHGLSKMTIIRVVDSFPQNFERFIDQDKNYVKLVTTLKLCERHCTKNSDCNGSIPFCTGLHLCKFFLLTGSCQFKQSCQFGHDLTTAHNRQLLIQHNLGKVGIANMKWLLQQSCTQQTAPKICKFYNVHAGCRNEDGSKCPNLHLCKHYVEGVCRFGQRCKRSHNIINREVKAILEKHGIPTNRTPKEILADLREMFRGGSGSERGSVDMRMGAAQRWSSQPMLNQMSTLSIRDGQSEDGLSDDSSESNGARLKSRGNRGRKGQGGLPPSGNLHFAQGRPPHGNQAAFNRPPSGAGAISKRTRNKELTSEMSMDKSGSQFICLYNLRGCCGFGTACRNFHSDRLYQWQYRDQISVEWENVEPACNKEMELTYCDAENDEHFLRIRDKQILQVSFDAKPMVAMDGNKTKYFIRRLSTPSSGEIENQPLTTLWNWYWKDQKKGTWVEYGNNNLMSYKATISSEDIEQSYLSKPEGSLIFATQGYEYVLNFERMHQRNLQSQTESAVRRRPAFVSDEEINERKKQQRKQKRPGIRQGNGGVAGQVVSAPTHWDIPRDTEDLLDHCQIVKLSERHPAFRKEYKEIEKLFCETMPSTVSIKCIERIENGDLWMNFMRKKTRMMKKGEVEERQLFHGTQTQYNDAICRQGFDFRLSGKTSGKRFGKGSYFATTAKYSNHFTDQENKIMFIVRVLVGKYTKGNESFVRPPSRDPSNPCSDLYDSCVNDEKNPTIFVIFDNNGQVYPEYVIQYEY